MMRIGIALTLTCLMAGCLFGGRAETIERFVVTPPLAVPAETQPAPGAPTLGLRPLVAANACRLQMAYRLGEQIGFREQEWAEAPAQTVTRAINDAIVNAHLFTDVGDASDMARPDYMLYGELRGFYENLDKDPAEATIVVRLEVRRAQETELLWADTLTAVVPLEASDSPALARAMSQAVAQVAEQTAAALRKALTS